MHLPLPFLALVNVLGSIPPFDFPPFPPAGSLLFIFPPHILQNPSFLSFGARSKRKGVCRDDVESSIRCVSSEEDTGHQEVNQRAWPSARPPSLIQQQWRENWEICTFILKKKRTFCLVLVERPQTTVITALPTWYSDWSLSNSDTKPRSVCSAQRPYEGNKRRHSLAL